MKTKEEIRHYLDTRFSPSEDDMVQIVRNDFDRILNSTASCVLITVEGAMPVLAEQLRTELEALHIGADLDMVIKVSYHPASEISFDDPIPCFQTPFTNLFLYIVISIRSLFSFINLNRLRFSTSISDGFDDSRSNFFKHLQTEQCAYHPLVFVCQPLLSIFEQTVYYLTLQFHLIPQYFFELMSCNTCRNPQNVFV